MKKLVQMIVLIFVCSMLAGQSHAEIDENAVVGMWLFEKGEGDVARDSSVNGNNGTINDATWVDGKVGGALEFKGTLTSYIEVPHSDELSLATFTIAAWMKTTPAGIQCIAQKQGSAGGPADRNYLLFTFATLACCFSVNDTWTGIAENNTVAVNDGEWRHVATTYDEDFKLTLYVDGVEEATSNFGSEPDTNEAPLRIGAGIVAFPFKGVLDEIGIFNQALTSDDIKNIMNNGLSSLIAAVEPYDRLCATWAVIKTQQ